MKQLGNYTHPECSTGLFMAYEDEAKKSKCSVCKKPFYTKEKKT